MSRLMAKAAYFFLPRRRWPKPIFLAISERASA
jgi:hypothetical protein